MPEPKRIKQSVAQYKGIQQPLPIEGFKPVRIDHERPERKPKTREPKTRKWKAWVSTAVLAEELGCEQKFIRESLKDSLFKAGIHYRNLNPQAWRPTYRWHLKKCLQEYSE